MVMRSGWLAGVAALALMSAATPALAGGFANRQQSATGQGMSFAGSGGSSFGLSSMFWNPAAVTYKIGRNSEWHFAFIAPQSDIKTQSASVFNPALGRFVPATLAGGTLRDSGDIGIDALGTASYSSYQLNERMWIGFNTGQAFGFRTKPNLDFAGRIYGSSSKSLSVGITPTFGYKVTDWLSVGIGLNLQYFKVNLKSATSPVPNAPGAILEGDNFSVGYTLGATLTPIQGTEISIGFRSSVRHELEGTFYAGITETPIKAAVNLPETLTVSLTQALGEKFDVTLTGQWTNWSRLGTVPVVNKNTGLPLAASPGLPFQYDDEWFIAAGVQYKHDGNWTFRAGVAYEESPVSDRVRSVRLTDNDRIWASLGLTYKWNEKLSFDLAYSHIFVKDSPITITAASGNPAFNRQFEYVGEAKPSVDIIAFSLKYRWDDPSPPSRAAVVKSF